MILVNDHLFVVARHLGGALHDDPMLGAVMVLLQAELAARLHHDVLYLDAVAGMDRAIGAPGAVDEGVRGELAAVVLFEAGDELFDVLCAIAMRHHHRVRGRHHHQILDAEHGEQAAFGAQIIVARILGDDVAGNHVADGILLADLPQRVPGSDVAPADLAGHHCGVLGMLHHRVVDRDVLGGGEGILVETDEIEIALRLRQGLAAGGDGGRPQPLHLGEIELGGKEEDAAVPDVIAGGDIFLGTGTVGLLDKGLDRENAGATG